MHGLRIGSFPELESALADHVAVARSRHGPLAPLLIVVPTALLRLHLRRRLPSHFNIRFVTLAELWRHVPAQQNELPPFGDELIADAIIKEHAKNGYFAPVSRTTGFRQCLLSAIRDLKEAGISSHDVAGARSAKLNRGKYGQLAGLYAAYEMELNRLHLSDEADLLARAADAPRSAPLAEDVCLYGFYDFNYLQRRFIRALANNQSLQVFVPFREESAYAFAEPTVKWLEHLLKVKRIPNPKSQVPSPKLEVISAPGEARECREILRESLAFCRERNLPLHEVGIIARGDEPYAPLLRDLTGARGWPLHAAMGRSAIEAVTPRLILLLLEIAATDFARGKVIEFATLAPGLSERAAEWDRFSAELGIVAGAAVWRERLRACAETRPAARGLADFIERLVRAVGRIPGEGRWSELTAATAAAAKELLSDSDELAAALERLRQLDALEPIQPKVAREDFARYVRKTFESSAEPEGAFQTGGQFVGGIMAARGVSWPMVIVPGLVEKNWPRQLREDPILLDEERRELNRLFPFEDKLDRLEQKVTRGMEEERMLFRLACDAARERLVITFPRLEPATGRPRLPSPFLFETLGVATFEQLKQRVHHVPLMPLVPAKGELLDLGEFDYQKLDELSRKHLSGVKPLLDAMSPTLAPGLLLEQTRWGGGARWTAYDGCLMQQESLEALRRIFDLSRHRWSMSRLEAYARSPFSFFLREVLGIEEFEEPEDAETISAMDFGSLFHELLSSIVQHFQLGNLLPLDPARSVENEVVLENQMKDVFAAFAARGVTGYPLVWRVKQEKIHADLLRWLRCEYSHAARGFSPVATEWAFGRTTDSPPAKIELDKKTTLLVAGQIDRVDRGPNDEVFVLDYKTGRPQAYRDASFCRARALQIPVYILATEQLTGKACGCGAYYFATKRGEFEKRGWTRDDLAASEPRLREILGCLVRSILAGKFFTTPDGADAAGTAFTKAAIETLWELRKDDETISDYRTATADDKADD